MAVAGIEPVPLAGPVLRPSTPLDRFGAVCGRTLAARVGAHDHSEAPAGLNVEALGVIAGVVHGARVGRGSDTEALVLEEPANRSRSHQMLKSPRGRITQIPGDESARVSSGVWQGELQGAGATGSFSIVPRRMSGPDKASPAGAIRPALTGPGRPCPRLNAPVGEW
jgi:hypothetical protein